MAKQPEGRRSRSFSRAAMSVTSPCTRLNCSSKRTVMAEVRVLRFSWAARSRCRLSFRVAMELIRAASSTPLSGLGRKSVAPASKARPIRSGARLAVMTTMGWLR